MRKIASRMNSIWQLIKRSSFAEIGSKLTTEENWVPFTEYLGKEIGLKDKMIPLYSWIYLKGIIMLVYFGNVSVSHFSSVTQFSSVQFSCSVMSDSLRPHELQHARPPCPSPTPGVHPDSCPSSQ